MRCAPVQLLPLLFLVLLVVAAPTVRSATPLGDDVQLAAGRSVDLFTRYGYLSISMKVVARNDTEFLFREPTATVFEGLEEQHVVRLSKKRKSVFVGDFHMEFCDDLKQLLQAYFREFSFERLERPWRAFTGGWSTETIAKNMGINASFVGKGYCYVLVRLARLRDSVKLMPVPNNVNLVDEVAKEVDKVKVGDVSSVLRFIKKFGSHYIESYTTGNALYQVFVYRKPLYENIKSRLRTQGVSRLEKMELGQYFSPWFAEHMGEVRVTSGNKTVQDWAAARLRTHYYIFSYSTILKLHGDAQLLAALNELLQNEAMLQLEMKTLAKAFKDPNKRDFFDEVLDNVLKLWESNL